eukprot:gb/GEZJ01006239.1/.p3 GENE.gb/GEZJ01006239.1/~~gb/GEZJ01006239.1/.p3  ORF type:complete len:103 (+),score=16.32 gb/GEZJ01006239.1/:847-1155(+)
MKDFKSELQEKAMKTAQTQAFTSFKNREKKAAGLLKKAAAEVDEDPNNRLQEEVQKLKKDVASLLSGKSPGAPSKTNKRGKGNNSPKAPNSPKTNKGNPPKT